MINKLLVQLGGYRSSSQCRDGSSEANTKCQSPSEPIGSVTSPLSVHRHRPIRFKVAGLSINKTRKLSDETAKIRWLSHRLLRLALPEERGQVEPSNHVNGNLSGFVCCLAKT
jgi:hypothetical protein